jgi:hypothetical protein
LAVDKQPRFGKLRAVMRRLASIPGITFALFFVWKVVLLLWTSQPVPANDAFFYDGPVVNYLLHGKYCNPSLAAALPISGAEVFSAYPPLHQFLLLVWMKFVGTSALAAMWYHVLLLGIFSLTVFVTLRRLNAPAAAVNLAGLFLFAITFHDRPDTLAHVLGALAVLTLIRGWNGRQVWGWVAALLLLLTCSTSLQIGGIYLVFLTLLTFGTALLQGIKFPWWPAIVFASAVIGLLALVRYGFPHLWVGFQEHLEITPSVTGWRRPGAGELLKIGRAAAGIFLVFGLLGWWFLAGRLRIQAVRESLPALVSIGGAITALALVVGCLVILTPNTIQIAYYLQPLIVGCFFAAWRGGLIGESPGRAIPALFAIAWLLVSIRAIGLTIWGALCAHDLGYPAAIDRVRAELAALPAGGNALLSSAFLYAAAPRTNVTCLHSDWPAKPGRETAGLVSLRATKFIVTQFDYYRRYEQSLRELAAMTNPPQFTISNTARVRPPDAYPRLQKVLQHVSWAPVVIDLSWPPASTSTNENATSWP